MTRRRNPKRPPKRLAVQSIGQGPETPYLDTRNPSVVAHDPRDAAIGAASALRPVALDDRSARLYEER